MLVNLVFICLRPVEKVVETSMRVIFEKTLDFSLAEPTESVIEI